MEGFEHSRRTSSSQASKGWGWAKEHHQDRPVSSAPIPQQHRPAGGGSPTFHAKFTVFLLKQNPCYNKVDVLVAIPSVALGEQKQSPHHLYLLWSCCGNGAVWHFL